MGSQVDTTEELTKKGDSEEFKRILRHTAMGTSLTAREIAAQARERSPDRSRAYPPSHLQMMMNPAKRAAFTERGVRTAFDFLPDLEKLMQDKIEFMEGLGGNRKYVLLNKKGWDVYNKLERQGLLNDKVLYPNTRLLPAHLELPNGEVPITLSTQRTRAIQKAQELGTGLQAFRCLGQLAEHHSAVIAAAVLFVRRLEEDNSPKAIAAITEGLARLAEALAEGPLRIGEVLKVFEEGFQAA